MATDLGSIGSNGALDASPDAEGRFLHECEVCGLQTKLNSDEAFDAGWDYPPRIGAFGVLSPRTCGDCPMSQTAWWAIMVQGRTTAEELDPRHLATMQRERAELD